MGKFLPIINPAEMEKNTIFAGNGENECDQILSQYIDLSINEKSLLRNISLKEIKNQAGDRVEKEVISYILNQVGWNKSRAARILKISYKSLLQKTKKFKILLPGSEW